LAVLGDQPVEAVSHLGDPNIEEIVASCLAMATLTPVSEPMSLSSPRRRTS
jgi:hypothetical protein